MLYYENKLKKLGFNGIIGVDEVGRGPLAGPVIACAAIIKETKFKNRIDDSKKLSPLKRELAFEELIKKSIFSIGIINHKVIDEVNILVATRMAMQQAILNLVKKLPPTLNFYVLVDGNMKLNIPYPSKSIIQGDSKSQSIAGASIIAKVIRDRIMTIYDRKFPGYYFRQHKGYPTMAHRQALKEQGSCAIHRLTFCGVS